MYNDSYLAHPCASGCGRMIDAGRFCLVCRKIRAGAVKRIWKRLRGRE